MSAAALGILAILCAAIPLAIVATTTFFDRRKERRAALDDYDTEGA